MDEVLKKHGTVFTGREVISVLNEHSLAIQYGQIMGDWHADTPGICGNCSPRIMHGLLSRENCIMKFVVKDRKLVGVLEIEFDKEGPIYHLVFDSSCVQH